MINLLPPKRLINIRIARSNTVIRRYIELVLLSIAVIAVAVAASYYFLNNQQRDVQKTVDLNHQKVAQLEPVQGEAEELSATVNTISGLLSRNVKFSDMLTQIGSLMPSGTVLTGIQFSIEDLKSPLVVSAQVESEERAAVLRNNLADSPLFKEAIIKSIVELDETDASGATSTAPSSPTPATTPSKPQPDEKPQSPYKYTTTIEAYFTDISKGIKP